MDNVARATVLLTLLVATSPTVRGDCNLHEIANNSPCGGQLVCSGDFSDAISDIEQMPCLYLYNDYSEEHIIRQNFSLSIEANDFDFTANDSTVINELKDHINAISITNGRIKKFPEAILNLRQATLVDLSGNTIDSLNLAAFARPSMLNVLNVSYNNIERLDVQLGWPSYWQLPVTTIDFSHNKIQGVLQSSIAPYVTLRYLNLSYNYIESFNRDTFSNLTGLLTLDISNNKITKLDSALAGLGNLEELFLNNNNLVSLNKDSFDGLIALQFLNISSNNLKNVSSSSFASLYLLKQLDLSHNVMQVILKSTFQNNSILHSLDVSFNKIWKIESGAFAGAHITDLKLHNNTLSGYLDIDAFNGLYFEKLDLSNADIGELGPDLFGPDPSFQLLDFSKNVIYKISKTTFRNLDRLVVLDLSYNKLQSIDFETTDLKKLSIFYINNNAIKQIRKETFEPLTALQTIDLSNNDISDIQSLSFEKLTDLRNLYLKNNPITNISPQTFNGLTSCSELDFSGSKIKTLENNSFNGMGSVVNLNLSHSYIELLEFNAFNNTGALTTLDLTNNRIQSFSVVNNLYLQTILLTSNYITAVTNMTFQKLNRATFIEMSYNKISYIQPGAFKDCKDLYHLNFNNNYLQFLQFGVFEGLDNIRILELSSNKFHRFDGKVFYDIPTLQVVYLDDNFITNINISVFLSTNIGTLSIGGNPLVCDVLTKSRLDSERTALSIVAKYPNFNTENVNGITCRSEFEINNTNQTRGTQVPGNDNLETLVKVTNRYLAANFGTLLCAMFVVLSIFIYYKFKNMFLCSRVLSSSREVLSNAIELESNE